MFLIAGLGNPEKEYKGTRHNMGFEVINKLAYDQGIPINKAKFRAHMGEGRMGGNKVVLLKPQTYMNRSGESVSQAVAFYKLPLDKLVVVYDDTSLEVGAVRVRMKGSSGGHKGMEDIIGRLGTEEIIRVRVGVGHKPPRMVLADYVLSRFLKEELDSMVEGITRGGDAVLTILTDGIDAAMNKFNRKEKDVDTL